MQEAETQHTGAAPRISQYDTLTVYGPLGIGWAITLAILAVVWKRLGSRDKEMEIQRGQFLAELERRDKAHAEREAARDKLFIEELERRERECRGERMEQRDAMIAMAKEFSEATKKTVEMWRENAREMKATLDSATRKIGSRE